MKLSSPVIVRSVRFGKTLMCSMFAIMKNSSWILSCGMVTVNVPGETDSWAPTRVMADLQSDLFHAIGSPKVLTTISLLFHRLVCKRSGGHEHRGNHVHLHADTQMSTDG